MEIFETCGLVNDLLNAGEENQARNELIKLLDHIEVNDLPYTELINHLIRATGLYPYLNLETASWQDKFVYEAFKVPVSHTKTVTLHREQSALLKKLIDGESIAVSAPTSFGKSFVIDAYITLKEPKNAMILVPTLALTDETRRRLYKKFAHKYKVITTSDATLGEKNIFIFPQERAINYVDKLTELDILIVDEFYKASSVFDKERSPMLIRAILQLGQIAKQRYFLAPNIKQLNENPFTEGMEFFPLDFNTVFLEKQDFSEEASDNEKKSKKYLEIIQANQNKTLTYAGTYTNIDELAGLLIANLPVVSSETLNEFADWLAEHYSYNWALTNLVKRGVGIHNGRLHRSLSQIQVKLFEESNGLHNILSTSSIIEGVNTSAENVVIWSNRNGKAKLDDFTYRNIMGRGGRMFKHFIGKIYILDNPPAQENTQLDLPLPEEILGSLDENKYAKELTKEQVAKIILFKNEMADIIGAGVLEKILSKYSFQNSDTELIKKIATDMVLNKNSWNGLGFLNSQNPSDWERMLFKILKLSPGDWEVKHTPFVSFIKVLRNNWLRSIPDLLRELEAFDLGLDDFFKLERRVAFKLSALLSDINILQKEIMPEKNYDISRFINWTSHAFLPPIAYQLEEFGLPRMISKQIQAAGIFDFYRNDRDVYDALKFFSEYGYDEMIYALQLKGFDLYILKYFFDGIQIENSVLK